MGAVLSGLKWTTCLVYLDDINERDFPRQPLEGSNAKKIRALRAFLGFLSYYRRFIDGFAMLAKHLHDLVGTKGQLSWGEESEKSFQALKRALEGATRLAYPDNSKPFEIHPDACDYGIGAALAQKMWKGKAQSLSLVDC